jgi:hypothetical protein
MKIALAILCIGAVAFLLRVLAALVKEGLRLPPSTVRVHFAKFQPTRRPEKLVEMNLPVQRRKFPTGTDERIAL